MAETKETLRDRLRERLEATGLTPRALSLAIGANAGYIRDVLDPEKAPMPSGTRLQAIAEQLGTTTDYLLGKVDSPAQVRSEVSLRELSPEWRGADRGGIPLLGTAYCDDLAIQSDDGLVEVERVLLESDHVVRMIQRPAALWAARDAYAIYFHGSSMEPRFFAGEVGIVDPQRPASPGDFVVVQLNDGESDSVITVLVKRLVRQTSTHVELEQFNPSLVFKVPRRQVARIHRLYGPNELLI